MAIFYNCSSIEIDAHHIDYLAAKAADFKQIKRTADKYYAKQLNH